MGVVVEFFLTQPWMQVFFSLAELESSGFEQLRYRQKSIDLN